MSKPRNSSNSGATDSNPGVVMDVQEANAKYSPVAEQQVPKGYKQSEVGVIPEDWELTPIGSSQPFVTSGSRGWAEFYADFGDSFIRITNLVRNSIYLDLDDLRFVNLPI